MSDPARGSDVIVAHDRPPSEAACPVYFGAEDRRLFGWYHPASGTAPRECAVVLCAPLGHETTGWHRALRHWAERLAAAGFATLRFDYHGTGDSAGDDGDSARLRAWVDSVGDAIDFVRISSGARSVALAGARFGATLALAAASERGDVDALILWAAFATGRAYLREGRAFTNLMAATVDSRSSAAEQIGGLALSAETVADLTAFDPLKERRTLAARALVIPRDEGSNDTAFVERLTRAGVAVDRKTVDGYAGVMVDAHRSVVPDALIDSTVEWLTARYPARAAANRGTLERSHLDHLLTLSSNERAGRAPNAAAAGVAETPIRIGQSGRLFGVLSRPVAGTGRRSGVLLVNSGGVYRVGPNRFYVTLARAWASLGYSVLRMDIGGLGDSRPPLGVPENHTYPDHVVGDIAAGLAELRARGAERVVVAGLCSGAHASFHAGIELEGVDGLLVINPIVFYWKPSDPLDVAAWINYNDLRHYKRSAWQSNSWVRLLRGKVDISYVTRVAMTRLKEVARAKRSSLARRFTERHHEPENAARDLERMATGGTDVLLLFSNGDPGLDFLTLNYGRELRKLERLPAFSLRVVDDADHTFTALDARQRAEIMLTEHLLSRHP